MTPSRTEVDQLILRLRNHINTLERDPQAIIHQRVNPYLCHQKLAELETLRQRCEDTSKLLCRLQNALEKSFSETAALLPTNE